MSFVKRNGDKNKNSREIRFLYKCLSLTVRRKTKKARRENAELCTLQNAQRKPLWKGYKRYKSKGRVHLQYHTSCKNMFSKRERLLPLGNVNYSQIMG